MEKWHNHQYKSQGKLWTTKSCRIKHCYATDVYYDHTTYMDICENYYDCSYCGRRPNEASYECMTCNRSVDLDIGVGIIVVIIISKQLQI